MMVDFFTCLSSMISNKMDRDFSAIQWGEGPYFIQIQMDETGGTAYEPMGTTQLLSVPYAMAAKTSQKADTARSLVLKNEEGNPFHIKINNSGHLFSEHYETIKLDTGTASKYFGGDDNLTRNVGTGQSIHFQNTFIPDSFSVNFSSRFDYFSNPDGTGHAVDLKLNVRDSLGTVIASSTKHVESSFDGGWVTFDMTYLNLTLKSTTKYIFTWHLINGINNEYSNGSSGDADAGFSMGSGYNSEITSGTDDLDDWAHWTNHSWDFYFRLYGIEQIE